MGRTRSPDSIKAEQLYHDGMKLVDIAKKMKVPEGTVRRWKSTQRWDDSTPQNGKKKQSERSDKKNNGKPSVRKRGAPIGNTNAKGHKTPKGNKFALKHGGYSPVYWDTLDDEEKELIDEMQSDPEVALIEQIKLYSVRERRLMKIINKYRNMAAPDGKEVQVAMQITSRSEHKRVFDGTPEEQEKQKERYDELIDRQIKKGERLPGRDVQHFTQTENKDALIARLEDQLTRCSSAKNKAIAELANIQREKAKLEMETVGSDVVNDWIAGVMGGATDE